MNRVLLFIFLAFFLTGCLDPAEPGNLVPKTVVEDHSIPNLEINNSKFHLETFGDPKKPVIFMLHGGPGNDYRYLLPLKERYENYSLVDDYFLVFFDQRGSGLSQRHDRSELTLEKYAEDLEKLVEHFAPNKNKPVIFIGHSWGGQYASLYMDRHPKRLSGAVMMEPGPLSSELGKKISTVKINPFAKWLNDWMWGRQVLTASDHERADYYLALGVLSQHEVKPERHSKSVPGWRMGTAVSLYVAIEALGGKSHFDFTKHLSQVESPILFIVGENTKDLGADYQRTQMQLFKNPILETIPNAGHNDIAFSEAAQSVAKIRKYLNGLNLRRP